MAKPTCPKYSEEGECKHETIEERGEYWWFFSFGCSQCGHKAQSNLLHVRWGARYDDTDYDCPFCGERPPITLR